MIDAVKGYVNSAQLPPGFRLMTWSDESVEVRGRLDLLVSNGFQGLLIVFVLLLLFLDPKLAFWVALGIPFALLAAGAFLYVTGQTLNQISMFAFVMALGIVVDDAIVVGENVFAHRQMGKSYMQAAIDGTRRSHSFGDDSRDDHHRRIRSVVVRQWNDGQVHRGDARGDHRHAAGVADRVRDDPALPLGSPRKAYSSN